MARESTSPGAQSATDRAIAAGLTAAREQKAKADKAKDLANAVKAKETTFKSILIQLDILNTQRTLLATQRTQKQNYYNSLVIGGVASAETISNAKKDLTTAINAVNKVEANIAAKAKEYALEKNNGKLSARAGAAQFRKEARVRKQLADAKKSKTDTSGPKNTQGGATAPPPKTIRFNAPMVTSAYFRTKTPSTNSLLAQGAIPKSAASLIDSLSTFGDGDTNRGFIVPNKRAQQAALKELDPKDKALVGGLQSYGFRFHYNPQFVQQSYGSITGISPELLESGKDQTNMITTPASSSSISITLYLNRIEDMNALGGVSGSVNTTTLEGIAAASAAKRPGKAINSDADSKLYYPEVVPAADRQLIKDFGTMYDLDFLFKAINGDMNGYKSPLRGIKTADVGWLNGIAVEVHMGRKLRYLARVTNISVNHVQFTENMVPTLTTVVLTMARFHDAMVKD
jgi:hypothetical protein